jgi:hypothetical protein
MATRKPDQEGLGVRGQGLGQGNSRPNPSPLAPHPSPDLGPCCACGIEGDTVRNVWMLPRLAPRAGSGWGCALCCLPPNGAIAVLCDFCHQVEAPLRFAVVGNPGDGVRIAISRLAPGVFEHDMRAHVMRGEI